MGYVTLGLKALAVVVGALMLLGLLIDSGGGNDMSRCVDHQMDEGHNSEAATAICE